MSFQPFPVLYCWYFFSDRLYSCEECPYFVTCFTFLFCSYIFWLKHCWWHKKFRISWLTRRVVMVIILVQFHVPLLISIFAIRLAISVLWLSINHFQRLKLDSEPPATETKIGCVICHRCLLEEFQQWTQHKKLQNNVRFTWHGGNSLYHYLGSASRVLRFVTLCNHLCWLLGVAVVNKSSSTLENFEIKFLKPIPSSHYAFHSRSIRPGNAEPRICRMK